MPAATWPVAGSGGESGRQSSSPRLSLAGEATIPPLEQTGIQQAPRLSVIIVAAGESRRMGGADKIFSPVLGLPLIAHTVEALEACPLVTQLVLVLSPAKVELGRNLAKERGWAKVTSVCPGGPRRQDSVRLGLELLDTCEWVAAHDGARPCVHAELLARGIEAAQETGAAVAAVPAKDTIKVVSSGGLVEATPQRDGLWVVQTPQVFRYDILLQAHRSCPDTVTDDAAMVESLGHKVKVFRGLYTNFKVTTPEDLVMIELLIKERLSHQELHSQKNTTA